MSPSSPATGCDQRGDNTGMQPVTSTTDRVPRLCSPTRARPAAAAEGACSADDYPADLTVLHLGGC
eukprot:3749522-Pyramimonas_sp.AAC.1